MKLLTRYLIQLFFPTFLAAILFFVLILQLSDAFANLNNYLNAQTGIINILLISLYYIPSCVSLALPVAMLFSVTFTMGNLYADNELIAVIGAGISVIRFVLPLLIISFLISVGSFFFDDRLVIPTLASKNKLSDEVLKSQEELDNSNITIFAADKRISYTVRRYIDSTQSIYDVIILRRDSEGNFVSLINGREGVWDGEVWRLQQCRIVTVDGDGNLDITYEESYNNNLFNEPPRSFQKQALSISEMSVAEAAVWIDYLRRSGFTYRRQQTDYYQRYANSLIPFIVTMFAAAIGGQFKKNILLMSLASSSVIVIIFYILQRIIFSNMGYNGYLPPAMAAWAPAVIFFILGLISFRYAHD